MLNIKIEVAVGMPVTRHPPHRSGREELPHPLVALLPQVYGAKIVALEMDVLHEAWESSCQFSYGNLPMLASEPYGSSF